MRKGKNPSKNVVLETCEVFHRVIIPLYIPEEDNYYKDAYSIFLYCVHSIRKTSVTELKISVVSNGSCTTVNEKLFNLLNESVIDELIVVKEIIGKINSIFKALRTATERFITITDADVLFVNDWDREIFKIFKSFPKAGVVSPVPVFRTHLRLTSNIWYNYFFSNKLKFLPVKDPVAMTMFANSIGWPWLDPKYKDVIATLQADNGTIAVLGNSHFVGTYKREVFSQAPKENSKYKLGGDSEYQYVDLPVIMMDGYRLATYSNHAFHLGNTLEDWMHQKFLELQEENTVELHLDDIPHLKKNYLKFYLVEKLFKKIFSSKKMYGKVLNIKGLTKEQIKNFID